MILNYNFSAKLPPFKIFHSLALKSTAPKTKLEWRISLYLHTCYQNVEVEQ